MRIFLFLSLILLLNSCQKWLDAKPDISLGTPASLKDFQLMMDYDEMINMWYPDIAEIAADYSRYENSFAINLDDYAKNAYTWTNYPAYRNQGYLCWANGGFSPYQKILFLNTIIEGLGKVVTDGASELQLKESLEGQAFFVRAKVFFELAQLFAPAYNSPTAETDLGIPIRIQSDLEKSIVRSSVAQTYNQIIQDLLLAQNKLPLTQPYNTRPNKPACFALLAKVYLSMEKYDDAKVAADSCIQLYNTLQDYRTIDSIPSFSFSLRNKEILFYSTLVNSTSTGNFLKVSSDFVSGYAINDLRKSLFFNKKTMSDTGYTFKGSYSGSQLIFNGLATDEVYLIRAECLAREGKTTDALTDLNNLMITRWKLGTFLPFSASTSDDALTIILNERNKELVRRGTRWSDMRRLSKDQRFTFTPVRMLNANVYSLPPNSFRYTFPIPNDIIVMSGIQQNPGWQ